MLNTYTRHFPFPHRGLKYFLRVLKPLGLTGKRYQKKLPGNFYMWLKPDDHIQQQLFWYGYYDKPLGDFLKKVIRNGDVLLDIGANTGYFSLLAAAFEPTISVAAFEPASEAYEQLKANIELNQFQNIKAVKAAAGDKNETVELFLSGKDNSGMSSLRKPENYSGETESIQVISMDDWFRQSGMKKVDIIKMDIEGGELNALAGMNEILHEFRPLLIVEINPQTLSSFGYSTKDILTFAGNSGYQAWRLNQNGRLNLLKTADELSSFNAAMIHRESTGKYNDLVEQG